MTTTTDDNTPLSATEQNVLDDICNTLQNARLWQCPNYPLTGISGSTYCHGSRCGTKLPGSNPEIKNEPFDHVLDQVILEFVDPAVEPDSDWVIKHFNPALILLENHRARLATEA
ncbi:hypothetical protein FCIRC_9847 [Fusarium circinatum]|uniref:Uncharacterized protein n=1 Tax=Fusarium circinatum TaxID=48490 RepID=A0A8H5T8P0_FUSCI|nr:hypothetical protein FCIRC_9847 [Fusarium circinatum]